MFKNRAPDRAYRMQQQGGNAKANFLFIHTARSDGFTLDRLHYSEHTGGSLTSGSDHFTPGRNPLYSQKRKLTGPQSRFIKFGVEKNLSHLPAIKPLPLACPGLWLVATPNTLTLFPKHINDSDK